MEPDAKYGFCRLGRPTCGGVHDLGVLDYKHPQIMDTPIDTFGPDVIFNA